MALKRKVRLGKQNRLTIPGEMLRRLGIRPGDEVELEESDVGLRVRRAGEAHDPVERAYGFLASGTTPATREHGEAPDLDHEAADYRGRVYVEDDERIRRTGA